jgi:hypothetical protein
VERVVWVSRQAGTRGERVSTTECPVSLISGESLAAVEEWLAVRRLGGPLDVGARPARTIDAWLALEAEREGLETNSNAD